MAILAKVLHDGKQYVVTCKLKLGGGRIIQTFSGNLFKTSSRVYEPQKTLSFDQEMIFKIGLLEFSICFLMPKTVENGKLPLYEGTLILSENVHLGLILTLIR